MIVLHNNKKGNNFIVANMIAKHFNCETLAAEDSPDITKYDKIVFVVSNVGDEELPQPMEDYLYNLKDTNKQYLVCELGNYFGFENYSGCKKVLFKMLDSLGWKLLSDISLDSLPKIDMVSLEMWLKTIAV